MEKIINFVDGLLARSTPQAPAWNVEAALEGKKPKWNYIDGCMIKAVLDLHYATGDKKYFDFAKNFIDFYVDENGGILGYRVEEYNCDNINMGKVLFDLYRATEDEKYKKAIMLLHSQLITHPRINAGNFWHKKIYPNQVWLDGLYMVQPFYMDYELLFGGKKNLSDIMAQFENVYNIMRDTQTGLFYHGYDESRQMFWADKETGLSKNFWTRSIGWYMMALVDTAEKLSVRGTVLLTRGEVECQENRPLDTLAIHLAETANALLKVADPLTKLFYQVINQPNREGNYLETSGSCAIAYSFMKGARLGYLPKSYFDHGKEIFDGVVKHKLGGSPDTAFTLKDICLVAGLGGMPGKGDYQPRDGTYEYYISEPRVDNDAKGVAPFLFAYCEIVRNEHL